MKPLAVHPAAFNQRDAAAYIGRRDPRWLDDAPIPRVDQRKPGAARPCWAWRRVDLDEFLASRLVQPGQVSPWADV